MLEFNKVFLNIILATELQQLKLNKVKYTIITLQILLGFGLLFLASFISNRGVHVKLVSM
jgi:hypothetical protein